MAKKALTAPQEPDDGAGSKIAEAILHFIGRIPSTDELKSDNPLDRARAIATSAATKAAITAGSLALRSEEHTSELQSHSDLVCRLLLEKKKKNKTQRYKKHTTH